MSLVFHREEGYVFKIYSNEEERKHIHVMSAEKECKVWLEPEIQIAENFGFSNSEQKKIIKIISDNADDFKHKFAIHIGKRIND